MNAIEASHRSMISGWAHPDRKQCACHGSGWILSDWDAWGKCPAHYNGQPNPEDYADQYFTEKNQEAENWAVALS